MATRSASVYRQYSPMKKPLFRMLWWDSVAPLGNPVVPLVYWMLIGSSKASVASRAASASGSSPAAAASVAATPAARTLSQPSVLMEIPSSRRGPPCGQRGRLVPGGGRVHRGHPGGQQLVPALSADEDHVFQAGQADADLADHRPVIAGLEALRADQQLDAGLAQHVGQLVGAV